ncbi:hypothetical protein EDD86DRAFT_181727, partial [Gorgonomyces haynaldii]
MSQYWTVSEGTANRTGWSCRECKQIIQKGTPIKVRDGRKMRFFYHTQCFVDADPRSQPSSSFDKYKHVVAPKAPPQKGRGKWSVASYGYQ